MSGAIDYDRLNLTELTHLVQQVEPRAHRGLPRGVLIAILEDEEVRLPDRIIDGKRLKIMQYIDKNWRSVNALLTCPAKTRDPHACFGCSDLQAASCVIDNSKRFLDD